VKHPGEGETRKGESPFDKTKKDRLSQEKFSKKEGTFVEKLLWDEYSAA